MSNNKFFGVVSYPKSSSNHNLGSIAMLNHPVVSYPKSSSNHNYQFVGEEDYFVVSYPKSSSNHNRIPLFMPL